MGLMVRSQMRIDAAIRERPVVRRRDHGAGFVRHRCELWCPNAQGSTVSAQVLRHRHATLGACPRPPRADYRLTNAEEPQSAAFTVTRGAIQPWQAPDADLSMAALRARLSARVHRPFAPFTGMVSLRQGLP